MQFPNKSNFLVYNNIGNDTYIVTEYFTKEHFEMPGDIVRFLKHLDGRTNPYDLAADMAPEEVDELLEELEDNLLLRAWKRFLPVSLGTLLFTVWIPSKIKTYHCYIARILNSILMLLCVPVLVLGLFVQFSGVWGGGYEYYDYNFWFVYIAVLLGSLVLHELSHACAGIAYGATVFEFGFMINMFLPGAYVMLDCDNIKNRFKRAQIYAAGVEMHVFLIGISLCLVPFGWIPSNILEIVALVNMFLAIFNLSLIEGIDGSRILGELLGESDLLEKAKSIIKNHKRRKNTVMKGINGKATVAVSYILVCMQALLPIVLIVNAIDIAIVFILEVF